MKYNINIRPFENLLFPKLCLSCHKIMDYQEFICVKCRHQILETNYHHIKENDTYKKFMGRCNLHFATSLCYFKDSSVIQDLLHQLKYKGQETIGVFLGKWLALDLKDLVSRHGFDVIVPVPLHKKKLKKRGYNQVAKFSDTLSEILKIECDHDLLIKTVHTKSSAKSNRFERWFPEMNPFNISKDVTKYRHILLADDIITTGNTIQNCYMALKKLGDIKVSAVSIANAV